MSEMEYTGDIYKCRDCKHIWDYNDTACPECGSLEDEDINKSQVLEERNKISRQIQELGKEMERLTTIYNRI